MSRLLPNLMMVFTFVLCGLCVFQWNREVGLRKDLAAMNDDIYKKKEAIQGLELNVRQAQEDIGRLEKARKELTETRIAHEKTIGNLTNEVELLVRQKDSVEGQLEQYKKALDSANDNIRKQNEDIKRQNEMLKEVAQQRNDRIAEIAKLTAEYNKVVKDYNKLVEDVNKMNEQAAAAQAERDKKK